MTIPCDPLLVEASNVLQALLESNALDAHPGYYRLVKDMHERLVPRVFGTQSNPLLVENLDTKGNLNAQSTHT